MKTSLVYTLILLHLFRSAQRRTFEKKEWEELRQKLEQWRENMLIIKGQLEQVVPSTI